MSRVIVLAGFAGLAACASAARPPEAVRLVTTDINHFIEAWDRVDPADPSCRGLGAYFDSASDGLREFREISGSEEELCEAVRRSPQRYAAIGDRRTQIEALDTVIHAMYRQFVDVYPEAVLPDVYIVVGRGWWGGTVRHGRVYVGAEVMQDTESIPCLVVHEAAHAQQRLPKWKTLTGGPAFFRGTLLAQALKEGSADFIAELVGGCAPAPERRAYAEARETELWQEFQRDMHGKDYKGWLYGQPGDGRPADLGYWMGYRITRAYYENAPDRERALRDIFRIRNFNRFLEQSGYSGGS